MGNWHSLCQKSVNYFNKYNLLRKAGTYLRIAKTSIKSTLISYLHNKKSKLPLVQEWQRIFSIQLPSERTRCIISAVRTCAAEAIRSVAHICVSANRITVVSAIHDAIRTISSSVSIKCVSTAKAIAARIISAVRTCTAAVHAYVAIVAAPFFGIITPRSTHSGYVLIVVTCFIPIVLLGIRYAEKLFEVKDVEIKRASTEKLVKQCAREASLAVARNWNPGLTLGQQRDGIYKVADAVYNAHPCYHDSPLGHALPGMVAKDENGNVINLSANQKTVSYKTDNTMYKGLWNGEFHNGGSLWNVYFGNWRESDLASESERRVSVFDELDITKLAESNFVLLHHDIREDPHPHYNFVPEAYPTDKYQTSGAQVYSYIPSKTTNYTNESYLPGSLISGLAGSDSQSQYGKYAGQSFTYSSRLVPSGTDYVEVSVENDKLKVRTDNQTDYATPAKCNVDIVLAVPVNGAASNIDGLDYASDTDSLAAATDTTGDPYKHFGTVTLPEEVKKTPIYQMGQALKNFVKEHFYHTRGVNMSLIPYSGKLSISPDRATSWTVAFPQFVDTSLNTQLMIGACLYSTSGVKDATLKQSYKTKALVSGATLPTTNTPYYWGGVLTGCPIMFRAGTRNISSIYGGNSYFSGFMLYTDDPSKGDSYKYLRMNLNPCYMGYANMLSMRCEKQCTHFLPNPYYIIEPTADLVKIYEMCNALYPIYDTHNVSNFVFAALEWANNMFQSWTNNPSIAAKDGSGAGNAGATSDATLSRPSKTTSGRKKAVILLVNKPDWFEPGEMTYLGFNNDFSEVPTVLSDKIDFSIDYSDTSKKFLDGSSYNTNHTEGDFSGIDNTAFLAAGANKILKCTVISGSVTRDTTSGYYCSPNTSKIRLSFPHKGLIKIVVKPHAVSNWTNIGSASAKVYGNTTGLNMCDMLCYGNGKLYFSREYNTAPQFGYYNTSNNTWGSLSARFTNYSTIWYSLRYMDSTLVTVLQGNGGHIWYYDLTNNRFDNIVHLNEYIDTPIYGSCFYNGDLYFGCGFDKLLRYNGSLPPDTSQVLSSDVNKGYRSAYYFNGRIYFIYNVESGRICYWDLNTKKRTTWPTSASATIYSDTWFNSICIMNGRVYFLAKTGKILANNLGGTVWEQIPGSGQTATGNTSENWESICTDGVSKLYIATTSTGTIACYEFKKGSLQLTSGVSGDIKKHEFDTQTEFFIEPSQLTAGSDGAYYLDFQINNVSLVSAEITNRPYTAITQTCSIEGTETQPYIKTNAKKNIMVDLTTTERKPAHITFYNNNNIANNIGRHPIFSAGKTFTFSGGQNPRYGYMDVNSTRGNNFGHNLSLYKVRYYCENCSITAATLTNQFIRDYEGQYNRGNNGQKRLILSNGSLANDGLANPYGTFGSVIPTGTFTSANSQWNTIRDYLKYFRDPCITDVYNMQKIYVTTGMMEYQGSLTSGAYYYTIYGLSGMSDLWVCAEGDTIWFHYNNGSNNVIATNLSGGCWAGVSATLNSNTQMFFRGGYVIQVYFKNWSCIKTLKSTSLYTYIPTGLTQNDGIYLVKLSSNLSNQIVAGNYVCFNGDGQLSITVKPNNETETKTCTMTLTPSTYTYSNQNNGYYYIYIDGVKKSQLSNVRFCDSSKAINFSKPSLPSRSSVVDFSQNVSGKPKYNADLVLYGSNVTYNNGSASVANTTVWDSTLGYWTTTNGGNDFWDMKPYSKNDSYVVWEDVSNGTIGTKLPGDTWCGHGVNGSANVTSAGGGSLVQLHSVCYRTGLTRFFFNAVENWPRLGFHGPSGYAFIVGGTTQPINVVLYKYGVEKSIVTTSTDNYVSPSNDFNQKVLKKLTSDACSKLKTSGVRVYVVKYRKQDKWNTLTRSGVVSYDSSSTAHSYTEIDTCATSTGGKVYDIGTAADDTASNGTSANVTALKKTLDDIAADIKNWAGYEDARNITD